MHYTVESKPYLPGWWTSAAERRIVVWLSDNGTLNINERAMLMAAKLLDDVSDIKMFSHSDECLTFVASVQDQEIFLIVDVSFGEYFLPRVHSLPQIIGIYLFTENQLMNEPYIKAYKKVKGIFPSIRLLYEQIREDSNFLEDNENLGFESIGVSDRQEASFMYAQLMKETLLKMTDDSLDETVEYCRKKYVGRSVPLSLIETFEKTYKSCSAIQWYTKGGFLYETVNKALRCHDINALFALRSFIRHLHTHLNSLYQCQPPIANALLYRGQCIANAELKKWQSNKGGLLSISFFFSTTESIEVAERFARSHLGRPNVTPIILIIRVDPSIEPNAPYANIDSLSEFSGEEKEWLFSMGTVFRINEIQPSSEGIYSIYLSLTDAKDPNLNEVMSVLKTKIQNENPICQLARLMLEMGYFPEAEKFFHMTLSSSDAAHWRFLGGVLSNLGYIYRELGDSDKALHFFERSLAVGLAHKDEHDLSNVTDRYSLSTIYTNIGCVYQDKNQLDLALKNHKCALQMAPDVPDVDHYLLSNYYNNIGTVLSLQKGYRRALSQLEIALNIKKEHLPLNDPSLAVVLINIGSIHLSQKNFKDAVTVFKEALDIQMKSLPRNHPNLAITHDNLAAALSRLDRLKEAFNHSSAAVQISTNALGPEHMRTLQYKKKLDFHRERVMGEQSATDCVKFILLNESLKKQMSNGQHSSSMGVRWELLMSQEHNETSGSDIENS